MAALSGRIRYDPALDGLRGVAIAAVLAFHAGAPWARGGFAGVDLFFVLSGYLITALLLAEQEAAGRVRFGRFYARRALRLLPALGLLLGVFLLASWLASPLPRFVAHLREAAAALFYFANWARALGWFEVRWLAHTWSLSIEEQFYLSWPLLLAVVLARRGSRRLLAGLAIGGALASALWRAQLAVGGAGFDRLYEGLDVRLDGLLLGCALACLERRAAANAAGPASSRTRGALVLGGLACALGFVLACALLEKRHTAFYLWQLPLLSLTCLGLVAAVRSPSSSALRRVLEWPPLVRLGAISYGVYLWHFPIFRLLVEDAWRWPQVLAAGGAATLAAALASHRWVERPALAWKERLEAPSR